MRIVMVGPFGLEPKGTMSARALPAARALAARGHQVTLLLPPWHTPAEAGRAFTDEPSGVTVENASLAGLGVPLLGHGVVAARLARRALALRPDVVHAFKPKAYSGLAAALVRGRQRLGRRVALVMDSDDWEGRGGWNELEPYSRLQRAFFARQEPWGLRHADRVTVASRHLETLALALGVPRAELAYLPNALDRLPAAVHPGGPDGERPTLLLYTRFFEFRLERPLEVLALVRRQVGAARLVVVGRGLFGEEERFVRAAEQAGLGGAVDYRGWLEPERAAQVLQEAHVALYPFDDTLVNRTKSPVKLLELLGAGLPVVADAVGELREVIRHQASGLLVAPADGAAMAAAAADLLLRPERRQALGSGARRRVAEAFLWSGRAAELEAVCAAAAAARRP